MAADVCQPFFGHIGERCQSGRRGSPDWGGAAEEEDWEDAGTPSQGEPEPPSRRQEAQEELVATLHQIEMENVSGVLRRLDSIRQLAGDAQVLRRKENREQNTRRLHVAQLYSLLLEEAEFSPEAVQQRNVLAMLEGIQVQHAEIFFFSVEEARKKGVVGPSVRLKDAISRPDLYAERMLVDSEVLSRMLTELQTHHIMELVNKNREYLAFKQTTYQVKPIEERDSYQVKNAASLALYKGWLFVADAVSHCVWRVTADLAGPGRHEVELFAGCVRKPGFEDGARLFARFCSPMGIVVAEQASTIFVADTENNAIRQIDLKMETVSTIMLELSPLVTDFLGASFLHPKGICVIHGDEGTLTEMDRCQQRQCEEFREQFEAMQQRLGEQSSSRDTTPSSSEDQEDGKDSSSGTSSHSASSCNAFSSSSDSSSSPSRYKACNSSPPSAPLLGAQMLGISTPHRGPGGLQVPLAGVLEHAHASPGPQGSEPLSLEQSLSFEWMKKYSVLSSPAPDVCAFPSLKATDRLPLPLPLPDVGSGFAPPRSQASTRRPSRRTSVAETVRDFGALDPLSQMRLAVTADHCVWFIDPNNGRAHILAGSPMQYGYCDAALGLDAKFSSPKGAIQVRSVLFVADYWNNVVRCVNLYTTQVDTVVNFFPQGPVAMCLSGSGVLYILDSDNVYCTNILRIMSTRRGADGHDNSTPQSMVEDRWWYQSLFSQPRTRTSSVMSDSTMITKRSEHWDAFGSKENAFSPVTAKVWPALERAPLSADFRSRLDAHLKDVAREKEEGTGSADQEPGRPSRVLRKKKRRHQRRRRDRKHKGSGDGLKKHDGSDSKEGRHQGSTPNIQISKVVSVWDNTFVPPAAGPDDATSVGITEGSEACVSPGLTGCSEHDSSPHNPPEYHSDLKRALQEQLQRFEEGPMEPPASGHVLRSALKGGSNGGALKSTPKGSPTTWSPSPTPKRTRELPGRDYVEKTKYVLSQMGSSAHGQDDAPMTLSDLGISSIRTPNSEVMPAARGMPGFSLVPTIATPVSENVKMSGSSVASVLIHNSDNDNYRFVGSAEESSAGTDAGSVMVCGGKAFYRSASTCWSEQKDNSRRTSVAAADEDQHTHWGRLEGEDEDGQRVVFIDLTVTRGETSKESGSGRVSLASCFHKAGEPMQQQTSDRASQRASFWGIDRNAEDDPVRSRRGSSSRRASIKGDRRTSFHVSVDHEDEDDGASARNSRRESLELSRRNSRRNSLLVPDKDSIKKVIARRRTIGVRAKSPVSTDAETKDRRRTIGVATLTVARALEGLGYERRSSLGSIGPFGKGPEGSPVAGVRRLSARQRRDSINIMPTVVDKDEREEEENDSNNTAAEAEENNGASELEGAAAGAAEEEKAEEEKASRDGERTDGTSASLSNGADTADGAGEGDDLASGSAAPLPPVEVERPAPTPSDTSDPAEACFVPLSKVPFTHDIDVTAFTSAAMSTSSLRDPEPDLSTNAEHLPTRRSTVATTTLGGTYKVKESKPSNTWRALPLPEPLSSAHRGTGRKYPNTPLSIVLYEHADNNSFFLGLMGFPHLLKIVPPKNNEPDKGGRFNVLPIDCHRMLLADETSHQIWLVHHRTKVKKHLAGCGKRGYLDGPLEICRMHSPCSMTLEPRSHYIYVADRGNHVIRKIDLLSGLMSTVVGNGSRGNADGGNRRRQALDSPFEVSFAEPHYLIISCADNSIRSFNLKTEYLETILVGS